MVAVCIALTMLGTPCLAGRLLCLGILARLQAFWISSGGPDQEWIQSWVSGPEFSFTRRGTEGREAGLCPQGGHAWPQGISAPPGLGCELCWGAGQQAAGEPGKRGW